MSAMEIFELNIQSSGFTDVTSQVVPLLTRWANDGLITGDALCCVTMRTAGAGLMVTDLDPASVPFSWSHQVPSHAPISIDWGLSTPLTASVDAHAPFTVDYGALRALFARTSEIFAVRGPTIAGGRRIHVLRYAGGYSVKCEVALSLL